MMDLIFSIFGKTFISATFLLIVVAIIYMIINPDDDTLTDRIFARISIFVGVVGLAIPSALFILCGIIAVLIAIWS